MKKLLYSLFALVTLLTAASCDKREQNILFPPGISENVSEIAKKEGLNIFAAAIVAAEMDTAFKYLGQFTMFAPTDAAFTAAGITTATLGTINKAVLRNILRNHILPGRTPSFSFLPGPGAAYGNINRDFIYTSGYFAPQPTQFLGSFFNGKKIVKADIIANNGILHSINGIMIPATGNLSTTLTADPNLSYLLAAIARAGLTSALDNLTAAVTLFAPNNQAFINAGFPTIASINAASPTVLSNIIRQHAISAAPAYGGRIFSSDVRTGMSFPALNGGLLTTAVSGTGTVSVKAPGNTANNPTVITADIMFRSLIASGAPSVMHIINEVLLP